MTKDEAIEIIVRKIATRLARDNDIFSIEQGENMYSSDVLEAIRMLSNDSN